MNDWQWFRHVRYSEIADRIAQGWILVPDKLTHHAEWSVLMRLCHCEIERLEKTHEFAPGFRDPKPR